MKKITVLLLALTIIFRASAQIEHPGSPVAFDLAQSKVIKTISLGKLNIDSLQAQDRLNNLKNRIGIVKELNIDFKKNAVLFSNDTMNIWVLKFTAEGPMAMNVYFNDFYLPKGAKLFVYNAQTKDILGAITYQNNKPYRKLSTRAIKGNEITIELQEPKDLETPADFVIEGIGLKYKATSGECEVNINCAEGDLWQTTKRSVAKIEFKSGLSWYVCTGALIANTKFNSTPFFLTANHCIGDNDEAQSTVFYFNYEALSCDGTTGDDSQTLSGATFLASGYDPVQGDKHLDFTLMLLSSVPPAIYYPYYSGWSRIVTPPDSTITIHHPSGDIKKISKDLDPPVIGTFTGYDDDAHWQIKRWDLGTTESGSSGAPLFDPEHRIIGDLTGGEADCTDPVNDYYSRFDLSWSKYSDDSMQLRVWLDSAGLNPVYIYGYDPYATTTVLSPPEDFGANIDSTTKVRLHWQAPGSTPMQINENFEYYNSFALQIPNWTMVDLDNGYTWGIEGVDFPNKNYIGSFIVFDWTQTDPPELDGWKPHSGNKALACFDVQPPDNPNNDWLISPVTHIDTNLYLVFYAKSVSDLYGNEVIRVGVSDGSTLPENFEFLTENNIEVPAYWKRYVFDLSKYKGQDIRIAINVISDNAFALLIDDIAVTGNPEGFKQTETGSVTTFNKSQADPQNPAIATGKALTSYLIYKNMQLYAEVPDTQLYFIDTENIDSAFYYVVANYGGDLSIPTDGVLITVKDTVSSRPKDNELKIFPNPSVNGKFTLSFNHFVRDATLELYNINGKLIFKDKLNNVKEKQYNFPDLNAGFYILVVETYYDLYTYKFVNITQ